jgi:phage tail protein X
MAIAGYQFMQVEGENVTADLIIWRFYMNKAPGMVEAMLDANPQLAFVHKYTFFIPPGTYVRVPIDYGLLANKPKPLPQDYLWTDKQSYTI